MVLTSLQLSLRSVNYFVFSFEPEIFVFKLGTQIVEELVLVWLKAIINHRLHLLLGPLFELPLLLCPNVPQLFTLQIVLGHVLNLLRLQFDDRWANKFGSNVQIAT